jgi:hypothetical protein
VQEHDRSGRPDEGADAGFGEGAEQQRGGEDAGQSSSRAHADAAGRMHQLPAAAPSLRDAGTRAFQHRPRTPGHNRRRCTVPGFDQRRAGAGDAEGLARFEDVIVEIARARQPDAA